MKQRMLSKNSFLPKTMVDHAVTMTFLLCVICSQLHLSTGDLPNMKKIDLGRNITKITYQDGSIFVGGENFLAVLSSSLELIFKLDIGPVYKQKDCFPRRNPCNNIVTVLEIDMFSNRLLVCGTAYQGTCVLHDLLDLTVYDCINAPKNQTTANRISAQITGATVVQILGQVLDSSDVGGGGGGGDGNGFEPIGEQEHCRSLNYSRMNFYTDVELIEIRKPMNFEQEHNNTTKQKRFQDDDVGLYAPEGTAGRKGRAGFGAGNPEDSDTLFPQWDVAGHREDRDTTLYPQWDVEKSPLPTATRILVASLPIPNKAGIVQPIISLREMRQPHFDFEMSFAGGQKANVTGLHVNKSVRSFDSHFKHAFTYGSFTYILSVRSSICTDGHSRSVICPVAILSRVNNTNPAVTPYIEMPLSCEIKNVKFDLLLSFAVGKISSSATGSNVETTMLVLAFGKEKRSGSARTADSLKDTGICVFTLDMIQDTFDICERGFTYIDPPPWIRRAGTEDKCDYLHIPEAFAPLGTSILLSGHVMSLFTYTPISLDNGKVKLNEKMHIYTANQKGLIHKFAVEASVSRTSVTAAIPEGNQPELVSDLSLDLQSLEPTTAGVTDNEKAVTYLAYATEIVRLNLDFCRQYVTCGACQHDSNLRRCSWCASVNSCLAKDAFQLGCKEDAVDSCPPQLNDFSPKEIPVSGGSVITLSGRNLGSPGAAGSVRVLVCNQSCDNVKPDMNSLVCTVRAKCETCPDRCYVFVEVNQRESNGKTSSRSMLDNGQLTYVVPKITSISPAFGPISGGVMITVEGDFLYVGTRAHLEVLGIKCTVNTRGEQFSQLTCKMESAFDPKTNSKRGRTLIDECGPMVLHVDDHVASSNSTEFCFRDDPKIERVEPAATLIRGGLTLTATGTNLDSVPSLILQISVSVVREKGLWPEIFQSPCDIVSPEEMTCDTPYLDRVEKEVAAVKYTKHYISSKMAFVKDNMDKIDMVQSETFRIFALPTLTGMTDDKMASYIYPRLENKLYQIKGQRIPDWLKASDIDITVGKTPCPVKNITSNHISCDVTAILRAYRRDIKIYREKKASTIAPTRTPTTIDPTQSKINDTTDNITTDNITTDNITADNITTDNITTYKLAVTTSMVTSSLVTATGANYRSEVAASSRDVTRKEGATLSTRDARVRRMKRQKPLEYDVRLDDDLGNRSSVSNPSPPIDQRRRNDLLVIEVKGNNKPEFQYLLQIRIGHYREILGYVNVGPIPKELIQPEEEIEKAGFPFPLIIGIVAGILVVGLIACVVWKVKKKRRAVRRRPYYMNDGTVVSAPGSSEASLPSLTQILETELEPSKKSEINELIISPDRLLLGKEIGSGNFGCVYEGMLAPKDKEMPLKVAIKTLQDPVSHALNLREFVKEAIIMVGFQHPRVLGLVGLVEKEMGVPYVVLPYMENGDLLTYVRDESKTLSLHDVIQFAADVCDGMAYLSSVKMVHRDLAARNCMLDNEYRAKVADFGLCRDIYEKGYYTSDNKKKLPIRWMAIESIERGAYSSKSDVWSMGVVLWELLTRGNTPYPGVNGWDIINFLRKRRLALPFFCPDELYRLMMKCWAKDPAMRPTFKAIHQEMLLLIGQDAFSDETSPVMTRYQKSSKSKENVDTGLGGQPAINIIPGTPIGATAQPHFDGMELGVLQKSSKHSALKKDETASCMSLPRSHVVENVIITIPACYNDRQISNSAASSYLDLVDNYEQAPKFSNPFSHRSKKRRGKSETNKMRTRKEGGSTFSIRSKGDRESGGSTAKQERKSSDYTLPFEGGQMPKSSDYTLPFEDGQVPMDNLRVRNKFLTNNYYELDRDSQRSSCNSILDDASDESDLMRSSRGRRVDDLRALDSDAISVAMSCQSEALSEEDLTRNSSHDTNHHDYNHLCGDDVGTEDKGRYQSWKEPKVELRSEEKAEVIERLKSDYIDPENSPDYHAWQDPTELTQRPESATSNYNIISEVNSDTAPDYQDSDYQDWDAIPDNGITTSL